MKVTAIIILVLTIAVGTYLNRMDSKKDDQAMIQDTVESSMAAPERSGPATVKPQMEVPKTSEIPL